MKKARIDSSNPEDTSLPASTASQPASTQVEQPCNEVQDATDGPETPKIEDGLAFWVATKTMNFRMCDMEVKLKKVLISAGFSIEECSVCYILSYIFTSSDS